MVDNYGSADRVECNDCGASIRRSNLSRHVALHGVQVRQRSSSAGSLSCRAVTIQRPQTVRSRSPSRDSNSSNATLDLPEPVGSNYGRAESVSELSAPADHRYGGLSFADYLVAGAAAVAVTEQHSIFDINRLCDFVARNYPQIPAAARPYLIIAAASGAQHAAHIHFFAESHFSSDDPNRKHLAQGARCSLSSWNLGLRSDTTSHVPGPSTMPTSDQDAQVNDSTKSRQHRPGPATERQGEHNARELSACLPYGSTVHAAPDETAEREGHSPLKSSSSGATMGSVTRVPLLDEVCLPVLRDESDIACRKHCLQVAEEDGIYESQTTDEPTMDEPVVEDHGHAVANVIVPSLTSVTPKLPILTVTITETDRSVADSQVRINNAAELVSSSPASDIQTVEGIQLHAESSTSTPPGNGPDATGVVISELEQQNSTALTTKEKSDKRVSVSAPSSIDRSTDVYKKVKIVRKSGATSTIPAAASSMNISRVEMDVEQSDTTDKAPVASTSQSSTEPVGSSSSLKGVRTATSTATDSRSSSETDSLSTKSRQSQPASTIDLTPAPDVDFDSPVNTLAANSKQTPTSPRRHESDRIKHRRSSPERHQDVEIINKNVDRRKDERRSSPTRFRIPLLTTNERRRERHRSRSPIRPPARRPVYLTDDELKEYERFKSQRRTQDRRN